MIEELIFLKENKLPFGFVTLAGVYRNEIFVKSINLEKNSFIYEIFSHDISDIKHLSYNVGDETHIVTNDSVVCHYGGTMSSQVMFGSSYIKP